MISRRQPGPRLAARPRTPPLDTYNLAARSESATDGKRRRLAPTRDADLEDPKALFALAKAGGPLMPNEMARRRYRQNPSRGSLRLGAREVTPGMAPECEPVLCDLVAFEHADNSTQAWLESMVDTQGREKCCERPENG